MKVAHINVNGIMTRNKLMEVKILLAETGIDILGITESKLHPKEHNDWEIAIDGYKFERQDRQQGGRWMSFVLQDSFEHCSLQSKEHGKQNGIHLGPDPAAFAKDHISSCLPTSK